MSANTHLGVEDFGSHDEEGNVLNLSHNVTRGEIDICEGEYHRIITRLAN